MVYLDNAATTKPNKDVLKIVKHCMENAWGNPSSIHNYGKAAKLIIETARKQVAKSINAEPEQIFFFSSATEANNAVLQNFTLRDCSVFEHSSVFHVHTEMFSPQICSYMLVNNETGDVFDVKDICETLHKRGSLFHTDATQAFGKISIDVKDLNVDFLTFSGHKIYAIKGCAVLYIKEPDKFIPNMIGGGQEKGIHPGTENVPAIAAMGKACELFDYNNLSDDVKQEMKTINETVIHMFIDSGLDFAINGIKNEHVDSILNISFKNIDGESLQDMLSNKGVYVSTSSACSSGIKKSRVLAAMNVPDDYIYGAIRLSFSYDDIINTDCYYDKIVHAISIIIDTVKELDILGGY